MQHSTGQHGLDSNVLLTMTAVTTAAVCADSFLAPLTAPIRQRTALSAVHPGTHTKAGSICSTAAQGLHDWLCQDSQFAHAI